jgi:hypothetical protein
MSKFLTELSVSLLDDDSIWVVTKPLIYESDLLGIIEVPVFFQTDFASVPKLPIVYAAFGDRAHRESVLHDYLYRTDSTPLASFMQANRVFLEAMEVRGKPFYIRYPMFLAVCAWGYFSYHKKKVNDKL